MNSVTAWESRGTRLALLDVDVFVIDHRAPREDAEPLLLLHGFPTCSFDWRHVLPAIGANRRVVMLDYPGFGLSAKPDRRYSLFDQADVVEACAKALDLDRVAMVTHDMGDSIGGELLARSLEGGLGFEVTKRVVTDGSIYMDLVQLSPGQELMLSLPDEMLPEEMAPNKDLFRASLSSTFSPAHPPGDEELDAQWELVARAGGNRLLPRLTRYIEERRVHEDRWTGAIETHPSPLTIVWGALDPIAVYPMAERLAERRPDATLVRLDDVGHFLMIEAPDRFAGAVNAALA